MTNPAYVLGHSDFELERLARQERLIGHTTREYFQSAGIAPGMRVLDVSSGTGIVAFHAVELVGTSGEVVGTDLAPAAVAAASAGAAARGLAQVSFCEGNPAEMTFDRPFDAIVGRYVLMFQADPSDMLRRLARHLRPGGVIVFHEPDWSFVRSDPAAPAYDRCCQWIAETFDRVGTSSNMSAKLHRAFLGAGLPPPTMRMQAVIGDAISAAEWLRSVAELTIVLAPTIAQQGLATLTDIGCDTLMDRASGTPPRSAASSSDAPRSARGCRSKLPGASTDGVRKQVAVAASSHHLAGIVSTSTARRLTAKPYPRGFVNVQAPS